MVVASHSVTIARPLPDVYRFIAEQYFEHATQWNPSTVTLKKTAPGPMGKGTTGYEVQINAGAKDPQQTGSLVKIVNKK